MVMDDVEDQEAARQRRVAWEARERQWRCAVAARREEVLRTGLCEHGCPVGLCRAGCASGA